MIRASGPGSVTYPGPALSAGWEVWTSPSGRSLRVLRAPTALDPSAAWCLPTAPVVAGPPADPEFGLTLVLSRQPAVSEVSVRDLVELGSFSLGLSLAGPPDLLAELGAMHGAALRPLFARSVDVALVDGATGEVWSSAQAAGPDATVALSGLLSRAATLAVLDALDGTAAMAGLRVRVSAGLAPVETTVRLIGFWRDLFDGWREVADPAGTLSRSSIAAVAARLVAAGVLDAEVDGGSDHGETLGLTDQPSTVADMLLRSASFLLTRVPAPDDAGPPDAGRPDPRDRAAERFALRTRPSAALALDLTVRTALPRRVDLDVMVVLRDVLGGRLDGLDADRFVRLVVPDADPVGFRPARRRRPTTARATRGGSDPAMAMSIEGGVLRSLPLVLTPDLAVEPTAAALLGGDIVSQPIAYAVGQRRYLLDDMVAVLPARPGQAEEELLELPLVTDPGALLWPDRTNPRRHWYVPSLDLVPVTAADDPATSGFLFAVTPTGLSQDLEQGLEATVRFRVSRTVPAGVDLAALPSGDVTDPVPVSGLSATLDVPYREVGTGRTLTQPFVGAVTEEADGTLTVTVSLLDDWVRLCYGALSYPGFQNLPARLRLSFAYRAYVPSGAGELRVVAGGKTIALQTFAQRALGSRSRDATLHLAGGGLQLEVEPTLRRRPLGEEAFLSLEPRPLRLQIAVTPPITEPAPPPPAPVLRSLVQEQTHDLLLPCAQVGALYRQVLAGTDQVIGCQDVLRLGVTTNRQYAEVGALADPGGRYRVLSSLQQPGMFLVVPARYRITRYGPDEPPERRFRPVAMLYGEVGRSHEETRYQLRATLQPDLPLDVRHDIESAVAAYTPFGHEPCLIFPTDPSLQCVASYSWAALPHGQDPVVVRSWEDLQVTVSAPLTDALLLVRLLEGAGFTGQVSFALSDGQQVTSALVLDSLAVGPWRGGPVTVELGAGTATLTNRIERTVSVFEVVIEDAAGRRTATAVDEQLAPGQATTRSVSSDAVDGWVRATPVGGPLDLDTLDVFVEDLTTELGIFGQVNFANHGLAALAVQVRRTGTEGPVQTTAVVEGRTDYLTLTFPVTTYLAPNGLEFRVSKSFTEGPSTVTGWLPWDLQSQGMLISISWETIQ